MTHAALIRPMGRSPRRRSRGLDTSTDRVSVGHPTLISLGGPEGVVLTTDEVAKVGCAGMIADEHRPTRSESTEAALRVCATLDVRQFSSGGETVIRRTSPRTSMTGSESPRLRAVTSGRVTARRGAPLASQAAPSAASVSLSPEAIDVHRRQILHLLLGEVEPDAVIDPHDGGDRDRPFLAAD